MTFVTDIAGLFLLAIGLGTAAALLVARIAGPLTDARVVVLPLSLAAVGACAGLAGGLSLTGVVGDIIPAFLGLLGAVALYLFGADWSKGLIVSVGAVALSVALLLSYGLGASYRHATSSDHMDLRAICAAAYTDADLLRDDVAFKRFEYVFGGLCHDAMSWELKIPGPSTCGDGAPCPGDCRPVHANPVLERVRRALFCRP